MDFIVIDTEEKQYIREIAIVDRHGKLIYEAFNQEKYLIKDLSYKPLRTIIEDFRAIAVDKILIFYNAEYDLAVLHRSFQQIN